MAGFALGVASSLAAALLCALVAWFGSNHIRGWLIAGLSRLTGVGVVRVHARQADAVDDMRAELAKARWIKVFASRGNELTRDSFMDIWTRAATRLEAVELLLPDPDIPLEGSWLAQRETEVSQHDRGFVAGLLGDQIRANIAYIQAHAQGKPTIELRLYDFPHLCRVVATDRVAFLTTYTDRDHGRNSPCIVFHRSSPMYDFAVRIFTIAWERARPTEFPAS